MGTQDFEVLYSDSVYKGKVTYKNPYLGHNQVVSGSSRL